MCIDGICGDGRKVGGNLGCDDGNIFNTDGCS